MGVAASIILLYKDAHRWFQMYIDKDSFLSNFSSMDDDGDKAITFEECRSFIQRNAMKYGENSLWRRILDSGPCLMMAHKIAAAGGGSWSSVGSVSSSHGRNTVDISQMKSLFIHLYVFCMLYQHFAMGQMEDPNLFKKKIDNFEFKIVCESLNALHSHEICDQRSLNEDFVLVDVNYTGKLGFVTICMMAEKYIDSHKEGDMSNTLGHRLVNTISSKQSKAQRILGIVDGANDVADMSSGPKQIYSGLSTAEKTEIAMMQMNCKLVNELSAIRRHHEIRIWKDANPGVKLPPALCGGATSQPVGVSKNVENEAGDSTLRRVMGSLGQGGSTKSVAFRISNILGLTGGGSAPVVPLSPSGENQENASTVVTKKTSASELESKYATLNEGDSFKMPCAPPTLDTSPIVSSITKVAVDQEGFALQTPLPDVMSIENMEAYNKQEAVRLQLLEESRHKEAIDKKERVPMGSTTGVISVSVPSGPSTTTASGETNKYAHLLNNVQRVGFHVASPPHRNKGK